MRCVPESLTSASLAGLSGVHPTKGLKDLIRSMVRLSSMDSYDPSLAYSTAAAEQVPLANGKRDPLAGPYSATSSDETHAAPPMGRVCAMCTIIIDTCPV